MSDTQAAPAPANTTRNTPTMTPDFTALAATAKELRRDVLTMLHAAASGHPGGSLGMTDVFTTLYFGGHMRVDPKNPAW